MHPLFNLTFMEKMTRTNDACIFNKQTPSSCVFWFISSERFFNSFLIFQFARTARRRVFPLYGRSQPMSNNPSRFAPVRRRPPKQPSDDATLVPPSLGPVRLHDDRDSLVPIALSVCSF